MTDRGDMAGGYIAVPVAAIYPAENSGVAFYQQTASDGRMQLYRGADYPIEAADLQSLSERGVTQLFVASEHRQAYQEYLRHNLDDMLVDESIPVQVRFQSLNVVVRDVLGEVFRKGDVSETIEQSKQLGQNAVDLICREDMVASDLFPVLYHDYHTFTHSANVAYYCVMLAKELGTDDECELRSIATGALLHDLGKLDISESILNKPGRLDKAEMDIVKKHPTTGFMKLNHREDLTFAQLMMVYQHHERLDGSGYPVGIVGEEIHDWARICAVADVFEALTSNRPYRGPMSTSEALTVMQRQSGSGFEESMFECWKTIIENV